MDVLDRSEPYATVYGQGVKLRYIQNRRGYNSRGDYMGPVNRFNELDPDAGVPEVKPVASSGESDIGSVDLSRLEATPENIVEVLNNLDPANDDHWTKAGLPSMRVLEDVFGKDLSRGDVEAAAPDFTRELLG